MANEIVVDHSNGFRCITRTRLNYATTTRGFDYEATVEVVVQSDGLLTEEQQTMVERTIGSLQAKLRQQGEDGVAQRNMDLQMRPPVKVTK